MMIIFCLYIFLIRSVSLRLLRYGVTLEEEDLEIAYQEALNLHRQFSPFSKSSLL
jgi:hypothetical protein